MQDEIRYAFASDGWLDAARTVLEELALAQGEEGQRFSMWERFGNVPSDVDPSGSTAWHLVIDGNSCKVGRGTVEDANVTVEADYEEALPFARLVYTPEYLAERAKAGPPAGMTHDGTPAPSYINELHNRMAVVTA